MSQADDELESVVSRVYAAGVADDLPLLSVAIANHVVDEASARSVAVAAGARLVRYKLGQRLEDLLAAVDGLDRAYVMEPSGSRAANLASALLELNDRPDQGSAAERVTRHTRALGLLRVALADAPRGSQSWMTRSVTLADALLFAVEHHLPGADLDELLDLLDELTDAVHDDERTRAQPFTVLGTALMVAADHGHPRGDLDRAVQALELAVQSTSSDHLDRPSRMSNLASALMDRYERTGRVEDLDRSITMHGEALRSFDAEEPAWGQALNNLGNSLRARFLRTGAQADLDELAALVGELVERFPPSHPYAAVARSNAGLIAADVASRRGDDALLDRAISLHDDAVRFTPYGHPQRPGRQSSLAVALMLRYQRRPDVSDLHRALELGQSVLAAPPGALHEQAIFMATQAMAHHEAYLRQGRVRDLETAARLHMAALDHLPPQSPFAAALFNNAATVLTDRYERLGAADDLVAALDALRRSIDTSGQLRGGDLAARLNNLALTLHRLYELTGDMDALAEADTLAAQALAEAGDGPLRPVILGTKLDVLTRLRDAVTDPGYRRVLERQLEATWATAADHVEDLRPASRGIWFLRAAGLMQARRIGTGRRTLLWAAVDASREGRPDVALAAARQLATAGLVDQVAGQEDGREVEKAAEAAAALVAVLRGSQEELRHALSWQREAEGVAALLAHSRLLRHDAGGAATAHDKGHAVLLTEALRPCLTEPDETTVTAWSTPIGGGAVIRRPGVAPVAVRLPELTTGLVSEWTRLLGKASRMGEPVLDRVLGRVIPGVSRALTGPLSVWLRPGEPVLWAAAGLLAVVPIAAGQTVDGDVFSARHQFRTAPTAPIGGWAHELAGQRDLAAASWASLAAPEPSMFPPLPGARVELDAFADAGHGFLGSDASVVRLLSEAESSSLVHVATHARTTAADPLTNHLLLAGDEPVFADDIARMATSARLVVLSACDTAAPGVEHADEALGLAGAFLSAGVPGIMASLWSVGDLGTSRHMARVASLLRDGHEPASALQQASALSREQDQRPGVWAAFVLLGA